MQINASGPEPAPATSLGLDPRSLPSLVVHDTKEVEHEEVKLLSQDMNSPSIVRARDLAPMHRADEDLAKMKEPVKQFYLRQNAVIMGFLELEAEQRSGKDEEEGPNCHRTVAINVSFLVNIALFVLKIIAAIRSGSVAVVASALDSFLDLLSGSLLYFIARAVRKTNPYKYPVSKDRLEPVGITVFAAIMGMASVRVIEDAVTSIADGANGHISSLDLDGMTLGIMGAVILSKLALFTYCTLFGGESGIVGALAQDHRNDVFTNTVGVASFIIAFYVRKAWFMDPVGALLLSMYIIMNWIRAGRDQIRMLVGRSAEPEFIGRLAYLAAHHHPRVQRVDKVLAYFFGPKYYCEVDIVLPEDMSLKEAHDIGEALEQKIEALDEVGRCFVHLDYEWQHKPEHRK